VKLKTVSLITLDDDGRLNGTVTISRVNRIDVWPLVTLITTVDEVFINIPTRRILSARFFTEGGSKP
jgi:hypothetical protein